MTEVLIGAAIIVATLFTIGLAVFALFGNDPGNPAPGAPVSVWVARLVLLVPIAYVIGAGVTRSWPFR